MTDSDDPNRQIPPGSAYQPPSDPGQPGADQAPGPGQPGQPGYPAAPGYPAPGYPAPGQPGPSAQGGYPAPGFPPPGGYPNPPQPGYPYPPQPGYAGPPGYPPQYPFAPQVPTYPYASWWSRVGAYLIDGLLVPLVGWLVAGLGAFLAFKDAYTTEVTTSSGYYWDETTTTSDLHGVNGFGIALLVFGIVLSLALVVWNDVFRQGRTGQSVGKSWLGIAVVREVDGHPLGVGMAFVRWLMLAIFGELCFLNFLWPLWDERRRCWHDMVVSSVVIQRP